MDADHSCARCRTPFLSAAPLDSAGVCTRCRSGLAGFDSAYAYGFYDGTLRQLLHLFKYGRVEPLAVPLGRLMQRALPLGESFDLVIPVPLHWQRRLWRGFNQSELLAHPVAERLGAPLSRVLRRTRSTATQASLPQSERRSNLTGAFVLADPGAVRDRRILLVDDVLTTGATAGAAGAVLRRAGARHVAVLTLARVDRRPLWAMPAPRGLSRSAGAK